MVQFFLSLSNLLAYAERVSASCSITQCILRLRNPGLSFTCCEENVPSLSNITFTQSKATAIAIINMQRMKVSIIFLIFACKDNASRAKCKINAGKTSFYFVFNLVAALPRFNGGTAVKACLRQT